MPKRFIVCVGFNPTAFVHYDAEPTGNGRSGLPGSLSEFRKGDWMIRVLVDRAK